MKIKHDKYYILFLLVIFSCASQKVIKKKIEDFNPFEQCSLPVAFFDIEDYNYGLKDLDDTSYSFTNTIIYGTSGISTDTLEKDSIRMSFSKLIKPKINSLLPNVKILNETNINNISPSKFYKNMRLIESEKNIDRNSKKRAIKTLSVSDDRSKQMLIFIKSFFSTETFKNKINIIIFDAQTFNLLYLDQIEYFCDIRDYDALEEVISYGLLKLKENFE
jgi:hypothetical protein